jgi:hypothetical protein
MQDEDPNEQKRTVAGHAAEEGAHPFFVKRSHDTPTMSPADESNDDGRQTPTPGPTVDDTPTAAPSDRPILDCPITYGIFNECVGNRGRFVSACEYCVINSWPTNPGAVTACSQVNDETCTGLSSVCSAVCSGCEREFIDFFECETGCYLGGSSCTPGTDRGASQEPASSPIGRNDR